MRALLVLVLLAAAVPAEARRGRLQILPPQVAVVPSGSAHVTVRGQHMRVVRLYCEGLYQGRRDMPGPFDGSNQTVTFLVQFPQIAKEGRWVIRGEGTDTDGDDIEPVEAFVFPTRDRDVRTVLDIRVPFSAEAPPAEAFTSPAIPLPPAPEFTIAVTPAYLVVEPGSTLEFAVQVFQRGVPITSKPEQLETTAGGIRGFVLTAPDAPGRLVVIARFGDGVGLATIDVGKPVPVDVTAWGIQQIRVSIEGMGSVLAFADPNSRPRRAVNALLLPAAKGKRVVVRVEGLDELGNVLATRTGELDVR